MLLLCGLENSRESIALDSVLFMDGMSYIRVVSVGP
jgi:hypothetical protein